MNSLEVVPSSSYFISGSDDGTVRIWDHRSPHSEGLLSFGGRPIAAVDKAGLVIAVAAGPRIRLFDIRQFEKGPYTDKRVFDPLRPTKSIEYAHLSFTDTAAHLIGTTSTRDHIHLLSALDGHHQKSLWQDGAKVIGEPCSTPDGSQLFWVSSEGKLMVWNVKNGKNCELLTLQHEDGITCAAFNPEYMMMATASSSLVRSRCPASLIICRRYGVKLIFKNYRDPCVRRIVFILGPLHLRTRVTVGMSDIVVAHPVRLIRQIAVHSWQSFLRCHHSPMPTVNGLLDWRNRVGRVYSESKDEAIPQKLEGKYLREK